jgi:hypothetical protein
MTKELSYRLSKERKIAIAQNLIDILEKDVDISEDTVTFIHKWLTTGSDGKRKAFYDIWDMVLKNYLPNTRPILFRACGRISNSDKIASFTVRIQFASRYSRGIGVLVICDTRETLKFKEDFGRPGEYRHSFYPLTEVLIKWKAAGWSGLSKEFLNMYIEADEYIMRINWGNMYGSRWV